MPLKEFAWRAVYEVGDPKIDAQHQRLFTLANQLLRADDEGALSLAVLQLQQHARTVFAHEEETMRRVGYADGERHRGLHGRLIERLEALGQDIAAGHWHGDGLMEFMTDWLLDHILDEDARLASYLPTAVRPARMLARG